MAWLNYAIIVVLLLFSGLFSGLTLGLMGLDVFQLKRKARLGSRSAQKIYPLRKKGNQLLTTLLVGNVLVNSILAIFLGSITFGVLAGILSTGLIVIFGEIIPQAAFSRHALRYGAKLTWLVRMFYVVLYPISKPIAMLLDFFLGGELPTTYSKGELNLILQEQKESKKSELSNHDVEILQRGLVFADRKVKDVMTPLQNTYHLFVNDVLDRTKLADIHKQGHSRIPVFGLDKKKVIGLLYTKDLLTINPSQRILVKQVMRKTVHSIRDSDTLEKVLKHFKQRKLHLFIVLNHKKQVSGIVTLEDVLEEIVGEIMDEYDLVMDMRNMKK